jgi:hypothetical protein
MQINYYKMTLKTAGLTTDKIKQFIPTKILINKLD